MSEVTTFINLVKNSVTDSFQVNEFVGLYHAMLFKEHIAKKLVEKFFNLAINSFQNGRNIKR